jgi:hypothetical protein
MELYGVGDKDFMENWETIQIQINHHQYKQLLMEQIGKKFLVEATMQRQ